MPLHKPYTAVIGLEVHAQLLLQSKLFAPDPTTYGALPNTQISAITLAHPGTLPKLNKQAVEYALMLGLACHSYIASKMMFARKSYSYPDLPKGYQITQDRTPICKGGSIAFPSPTGQIRTIHLQRIHLEEDAGKSIHHTVAGKTLLDFNRAGMPLLEIVTEPTIRTPEEAYHVLTAFRRLLRYLAICDGNMEEGSLRCDANVSVKPQGTTVLGSKVEIKNMNSIRHVQAAIAYEITRQIELLEAGQQVVSETRAYQATTGKTTRQRTKETCTDYRYFTDPDLPPVVISDEWVRAIRQQLPLLPSAYVEKFTYTYQLSAYDAAVLTDQKEICLFFEALCQWTPHYKAAANWVMGPVKAYLNEKKCTIQEFPLLPQTLAAVIALVENGEISYSAAVQQLYPALLASPQTNPVLLAQSRNLLQKNDVAWLNTLIADILAAYPDKVAAYKQGKKGLLAMFMGEVMKKSQGKAAPQVASTLLQQQLEA